MLAQNTHSRLLMAAGLRDELDDGALCGEGFAAPIDRDEREEAVIYFYRHRFGCKPCRRRGWQVRMSDGHVTGNIVSPVTSPVTLASGRCDFERDHPADSAQGAAWADQPSPAQEGGPGPLGNGAAHRHTQGGGAARDQMSILDPDPLSQPPTLRMLARLLDATHLHKVA